MSAHRGAESVVWVTVAAFPMTATNARQDVAPVALKEGALVGAGAVKEERGEAELEMAQRELHVRLGVG
jgi:hypothetical protein